MLPRSWCGLAVVLAICSLGLNLAPPGAPPGICCGSGCHVIPGNLIQVWAMAELRPVWPGLAPPPGSGKLAALHQRPLGADPGGLCVRD
jgi:hypothetical protein